MDDRVSLVEDQIDNWLYKRLDASLPRNKYIYHCNLAYIDLVIDQKILFSPFEKHYLFSLDYNTHIAHKKLAEEDNFDFSFDRKLYVYAFDMIIRGFQYSMLCDIFPLLHSEKADMVIEGQNISFHVKNLPKKNYKYISDYSMRKALSYTLQMASGKLQDCDDESAAMKLADIYMHFWNENMVYDDYEPYTRLDYGGVSFFFILAAMRRFNKLYRKDFDIVSLDSQKMMIILSPNGVSELRGYVPGKNDTLYNMALEDHIYKPIGKGTFPKLSVADAFLNRTSDGYLFANPLVILFNDSCETQFLSFLRKCDNARYLRIKDKIKERVIPLISEMVKYKFPTVTPIPNFYVKIPLQKKNRRECDLLLVDESGIAIYIEVKHYYYPQSFCETKKVDSELSKALGKMPDQLQAITENWDAIKNTYHVTCNLEELHGIIVSHHYTGFDVEIDCNTPIVSATTLYESIAGAQCLKDIYIGCKEIDEIYPSIHFLKKDLAIDFAGYTFHLEVECLDPLFEVQFIRSYRKQIFKSVSSTRPNSYKNVQDLARAYIDELNS
jgi:hypothetical protein